MTGWAGRIGAWSLRLALLGLGAFALIALSALRLSQDGEAAHARASALAGAAAERAQAGLMELTARFERVTGSLRAADVSGDTTALSARLLRAEPLLAPAQALHVFNARGRLVAATTPPTADDEALQPMLATATADARGTVLVRRPGLGGDGVLMARRVEDGSRSLAGTVTASVSAEALRALVVPGRLPGAEIRVADAGGSELFRIMTPPAPTLSAPDWAAWLLAHTPAEWQAPALVSVPFGAAGLTGSIRVAVPSPTGFSHAEAWGAGCAAAFGAMVVLTLLPLRRRAKPGLALPMADASEIEALRQKLDEAGAERNRVLAAIGHDVRTPINSILGISALLMDGTVDEGQRKWLHRIRASCDALLAMLNGMLEIAAAGMDGAEIHREPCDVATLSEEIGEVLRPQAHDKGLEFQVRIDPAVLGAWQVDPTRLRQVLFNLAGNAIKYTSQGHVTVAVEMGESEGRLRFVVSDTGPGIAQEEREQVFEQFRRGRGAVMQGQEGLGLGLALCREIAVLLGGTLVLQAGEASGCVFVFEIPAERIAPESAGAPLKGRTALVVGLSDGVRRRAASHLEQMGFVVDTAADGFMALGLAERTVFRHGCLDLVLVDAVMTGMSAETLLRRLQSGAHGDRLRSIAVAHGAINSDIADLADTIVPHPVEAQGIERAVTALFGSSTVLQEMDPRAAPPAPLRVLVVEDNRINQLLFIDVLARAGFSAFAASSGEEAVDAALRGGFDAILMDVQMPGIDGVEATLRIRAAEAPAHTPIVGLTAHTGAGVRKRCFDAGMDSVLHKPLDLSRLPFRLREAVAAGRALRIKTQPFEAATPLGDDALDSATALDIADEYLVGLIGEVGVERARSCMEDFLAQMEGTLPQLRDLADGDLPALAHLAHNVAGVAGTIGVTGLLDGLLLLEDAARQADPVRVLIALREVGQTWARVSRTLRPRFDQLAGEDNWPDSGIRRAA